MTAILATRPEVLNLFAPGAVLTHLGSGLTWAEGPVYLPGRQAVLFSDVRENRTWRWTQEGGMEVEMHPSHHQNGHTLDREGRLIACSHGLRALMRQEPDGTWTTLADRFEGRRLSSPNDVALHPDGSLWFTDPTYGIDQPEEGYGGEKEQPGNFVYRLAPDGTLTAPIRERVQPNGLAFPSADRLLLADTGDGEGHIYAYRVTPGGTAELQGRWATVRPGLTDGLRVDEAGHVWSSAGDGVHILSPDGEELGRVPVPETVSNLCFGGRDGTDLFITATGSLYHIPTRVRERRF
ncbi:SMP-30/gluconolactonase/LRE family protein [Deinococcus hopiensis]|uniref:Gluconolactonase n=1 Tax=Deinococcus hopiensis KR-140 TaxID=695939 RepID=A0A1W1V7I6_9DEIO|nr:SMP-30/gluconolactonase/LRE family protein [Deinococcus hopiensis]SMB89322.1 gluconolactonase [Deinococcus hopiensis KR-140]